MTWRHVLLLVLGLALTSTYGALGVVLAYAAIGYVLVRVAWVARGRLRGDAANLATACSLWLWIAVWQALKPGADASRWIGFATGVSVPVIPSIVGASYIFLKVYDLMQRAQRGVAPPGAVTFFTQMTFYPSFVAGPISGPEPFAGGFAPTRASVAEGLDRIVTGIFKLYVVAQLLQQANVLGAPDARALAAVMTRSELWLSVYASALWIYFNFAGYTDLAIGMGLLAGVRLPENFDAPYLAPNPSEFWQRWHMSFTAWLREHVFSPVSRALVARGLGGSSIALVMATSATMIVCGIWHRVSVEFLVWGGYHALVVSAHQLFATRWKPRLAAAGLGGFFSGRTYRVLGTLVTFQLMTLGWVLFLPIDSPLADRLAILGRLFA